MDDTRLVEALKGIYRVNLGARPGEKILVFTDIIASGESLDPAQRGRREGIVKVARSTAEAGRELGMEVAYTEFAALGSHGTEPGYELWRLAFGDAAVSELDESGLLGSLRGKTAGTDEVERARMIVRGHKDEAVDAVIALSNYSTSHTRFRDLLTSEAGARYASMPLFEEDMLWGSMQVDWDGVERRSRKVADVVNRGVSARVTTPDGTDITFGIQGRKAMLDTGILREPGSFSNLPAGEVYLAPVEGTAKGVLVINWAPNRKLSSPIKVFVEDGLAGEVMGEEPYVSDLVSGLDRMPLNRNIAELGIGTNDKADRPDNVLESEKIMGTVHIAFGDNSSMGGKVSTPFHQDFVYFSPTLAVRTAEGAELIVLKDGVLVAGGRKEL